MARTLKVTAPTPVSPANGSTLEDNSVPLRISASTAKFTSSAGPLAYRFQILLNGQVVKEARVGALQWALPDLESNTNYSWRARAEQGIVLRPVVGGVDVQDGRAAGRLHPRR